MPIFLLHINGGVFMIHDEISFIHIIIFVKKRKFHRGVRVLSSWC